MSPVQTDLELAEAFAFAASADERAALLARLIAGTDEHYYYSCLVAEQSGDLARERALLDEWVHRHGETARAAEIRARLLLLEWRDDTADELRRRLGLTLDHQREAERQAIVYPSRLDDGLLAREALYRQARYDDSDDPRGFTDAAIDRLLDEKELPPAFRRALLQRVRRPDHPRLAAHILADLAHKGSRGFGSIPIHQRLTSDQLDELVRGRPALAAEPAFVEARLARLQPRTDVDLDADLDAREAYLERVWRYVATLPAAFTSLRAQLLLQLLEVDRRRGRTDRARLVEYLKLPRNASWVEPAWRKRHADANATFVELGGGVTGLAVATLTDDEPIVRHHLSRLLVDADEVDDLAAWVRVDWLRELQAVAKLLAGAPDEARWSAVLGPARLAELRDAVELTFAPENPTRLRAADPVVLEVDVKNVPSLTMKVFELDGWRYALAHGRAVDTGVDLDGLIAADERVLSFDGTPPIRRLRHRIELPELARPGLFVVELIGNGRSSRALLRKGGLRAIERAGAAGHVFHVVDDDGRHLPQASIWFEGREHAADAEGRILIPFSSIGNRSRTILLRAGALVAEATFEHRAESIDFGAGIYVDRESLVRGAQARALIRPSLAIAGAPASVTLVEEAVLSIAAVDRAGATATRDIPLTLSDDAEAIADFAVPDELRSLTLTVRGKVRSLTEARRIDVAATRALEINGLDDGAEIADLHFAATDGGFVLSYLGKSGEPRPGVALRLGLHHREVTRTIEVTLQTDAAGRVELGALDGIATVDAATPGGLERSFAVPVARTRRPARLHGRLGEELRLPFDGPLTRERVALVETVRGLPLRDRFSSLELVDGALAIRATDAVELELHLKDEEAIVAIRYAPGDNELAGWLLDRDGLLELRRAPALAIAEARADADAVEIRLQGATSSTRVHLLGARFAPAFRAFEPLGRAVTVEPRALSWPPPRSQHLSGRDVGDEIRYVFDRRRARRMAGVLLERPGLLLNPWPVRQTSTALQHAKGGEAYASMPTAGAPMPAAEMAADEEAERYGGGAAGSATLDFLPAPAVVLANLRPDEHGLVRVPRAELGRAGHLRIVAVDGEAALERHLPLAERRDATRDLRLERALPADEHFVRRREITAVAEGGELVVEDASTARLQPVDTIGRAFGILRALCSDKRLDRVAGWIARWPSLTPEEKRARYDELACHELHLFLSRKDPAFFDEVIRLYLRNKRRRTFLDDYLLDENLAPHLTPQGFARLNAAERALLAGRLGPGEREEIARHLSDRCELRPPDPDAEEARFRVVLAGSALDTEPDVVVAASREERKRDADKTVMMPASSPATGYSMGGPGGAGGGGMPPPAPPPRAAAPMRKRAARRADLDDDLSLREAYRPSYQTVEKTREWAETHYLEVPLSQLGPELIAPNELWRDLARHAGGPFLSPHLTLASSSFAEVMFALAVLDLPFEAPPPDVSVEAGRLRMRPRAPLLVFHEQLRPAAPPSGGTILVGQNYLRDDDRTRWVDGEAVEKYVDEFLVHTVYVCQVALTNPTSTRQKLDVLLQIPRGAIPVRAGFVTRGAPIRLEPYATQTMEYAFYFPLPGDAPHFPVHCARGEALVAAAAPRKVPVLTAPSEVDAGSWAWVSQHASDEDVLAMLERENVDRLDLSLCAWRLAERGFYDRAVALLERRRAWARDVWGYSVKHADLPRVRDLLANEPGLLDQAGLLFDGPLAVSDPLERRRFEHLEYAPLVNARAHRLGGKREILNDRLALQWRTFLAILAYKRPPLDAEDRLAATYYLLLQDRFEEGLAMLRTVDEAGVRERLQLDYLRVWAAFIEERLEDARAIATRHRAHPVLRWRRRFQDALAQLDEAAGVTAGAVDGAGDDAARRQARLAESEPALELAIEGRAVVLTHRNVEAAQLAFYRLDVEVLFSRQPFVLGEVSRFSYIAPNRALRVALDKKSGTTRVEIPADLGGDLVVEASAAGIRRAQPCFAQDLALDVVETFGEVRVGERANGRPVPRAYVKCYARMKDGDVRFYKDGYTDVRGRFDYATLSTDELDRVDRFALLVLDDQRGALIREAAPPRR